MLHLGPCQGPRSCLQSSPYCFLVFPPPCVLSDPVCLSLVVFCVLSCLVPCTSLLCLFSVQLCTFPVLFCILTSLLVSDTSLPALVYSACLITCSAPISFICPLLVHSPVSDFLIHTHQSPALCSLSVCLSFFLMLPWTLFLCFLLVFQCAFVPMDSVPAFCSHVPKCFPCLPGSCLFCLPVSLFCNKYLCSASTLPPSCQHLGPPCTTHNSTNWPVWTKLMSHAL